MGKIKLWILLITMILVSERVFADSPTQKKEVRGHLAECFRLYYKERKGAKEYVHTLYCYI